MSCNKKTNILGKLIIVLLVVCIVMIWAYYHCASSNFSSDPSDWGSFGSYLASVTGILAFVGTLYNLQFLEKRAEEVDEISKNRHREDSERNIFFQLLELHTKKVDSVIFESKNGSEAFKEYARIANIYLSLHFMYENIDKIETQTQFNELKSKNDFVLQQIFFVYNVHFSDKKYTAQDISFKEVNMIKTSVELNKQKDYIYIYDETLDKKRLKEFIKEVIKSKKSEEIYNSIKFVADLMYEKYGHILGHYFRNMYYVMDSINKFDDQKNYKELFRAQLSRYELILCFFNAVSTNSSLEMVELVETFDILKDIYIDDLYILENPLKMIKNVLTEYKTFKANKTET